MAVPNLDTNEDDAAEPPSDFLDNTEDKLLKKKILLDTILDKLPGSNDGHEVLKQLSQAIDSGDNLNADVLSGGYTNYSYKVYVEGNPDLCIFAKLCFEYALWNPDRSALYDLKRTENEYELMVQVSKVSPECVVAPLGCWDLVYEGEKMKILASVWSKADEQLANQFVDGSIDPRLAPKIAKTLALLNLESFDENFNEQVHGSILNLFDSSAAHIQDLCATTKPADRVEEYCANVGAELEAAYKEMITNYLTKECLMHNDSHVFNILAEAKPSIEQLEEFGPEGRICLVDWEMCTPGPIGRDIGLAMSFPFVCALTHALNGHLAPVDSIVSYINTLLDVYLKQMKDSGKSDDELASIIRTIFGQSGAFLYLCFYFIKVQDIFPSQSDDDKVMIQETAGVLGLKFIHFAFGDTSNATSGELRAKFMIFYDEEMARMNDVFKSRKQKMRTRKSSLFRAESRRFSDASMMVLGAESARRLSISASDRTIDRRSSMAKLAKDMSTRFEV